MADVVRLLETVDADTVPHGVLLTQGRKALRVRGPQQWLAGAVALLRQGVPRPGTGSALDRLVGELAGQGWITGEPPAREEEVNGLPHQRQLGYLQLFGPEPARMQRRLDAARVAVVGVGGIGALLVQQLTAAGVRRLWLLDHDRVEIHNLNRQHLYTLEDIGALKVAVAARRLTALAPDAEVTGIRRRIVVPEDLEVLPAHLDLLVVAADAPAGITGICWSWAVSAGVPLAVAAVGLDTGYWGPLLDPALGHCWWCFDAGRRARLGHDEARMEAAAHDPVPYSFGPSNAAVAALLAHDVLRWLASGSAPMLGARGHLRFDTGETAFLRGPETCRCRSSHSTDQP
ncbi:ThiF family adenylyltransferase [Streptomyces sp. SYSU K217416]